MTAKFLAQQNPNSQHQRWSHWAFYVRASSSKRPPVQEVRVNAQRYFKAGFGTAGRVRVIQRGLLYIIEVQVEGPPVHDPGYRAAVKKDFADKFMFKGFGASALLVRFNAKLLAGSPEDGRPADQLLVLPTIPLILEDTDDGKRPL